MKSPSTRQDRRGRRLSLTGAGRALLAKALPLWSETHDAIERQLAAPDDLRTALRALALRRAGVHRHAGLSRL